MSGVSLGDLPVTDQERRLLDERLEAYLHSKEQVIPWEELRAKLSPQDPTKACDKV